MTRTIIQPTLPAAVRYTEAFRTPGAWHPVTHDVKWAYFSGLPMALDLERWALDFGAIISVLRG